MTIHSLLWPSKAQEVVHGGGGGGGGTTNRGSNVGTVLCRVLQSTAFLWLSYTECNEQNFLH